MSRSKHSNIFKCLKTKRQSNFLDGEIDKICFLFWSFPDNNPSSESISSPFISNQYIEMEQYENDQNTFDDLIPASFHRWGIVIFINNGTNNDGYAKTIQSSTENAKLKCSIEYWDDKVGGQESEPGLEMKELPMDGKKYKYDKEKLDDLIKNVNDRNDENDSIHYNFQMFVNQMFQMLEKDKVENIPDEKINKVAFVFRNLNKDNSSCQPQPFSLNVNQDVEMGPLIEETNQWASLNHSSIQHWGLVIFISSVNRNHGYSKLIEATIHNQKIKCELLDWDNNVEEFWRSSPGFEMNEIPLKGKAYHYNEEKLKQFIERFNDKKDAYDPILRNCQKFVTMVLEELELKVISSQLPPPIKVWWEILLFMVLSIFMHIFFIVCTTKYFLSDDPIPKMIRKSIVHFSVAQKVKYGLGIGLGSLFCSCIILYEIFKRYNHFKSKPIFSFVLVLYVVICTLECSISMVFVWWFGYFIGFTNAYNKQAVQICSLTYGGLMILTLPCLLYLYKVKRNCLAVLLYNLFGMVLYMIFLSVLFI